MKTKITIISFLFIFSITGFSQNWQSTGISTTTNQGVYDLEVHNSILFASVNNDGFIKSTDEGASWVKVNQTGFTTNSGSTRVSHILSANNDLYVVTFYAITSSSMVYKSSDNGATFTKDIDGLPLAPNDNTRVQNLNNIFYFNGFLITTFNGGGFMKKLTDNNWQAISNSNTKLSEYYEFYNNSLYAFPNYGMYISADDGETWAKPTNTNLPNLFVPNNFTVDKVSGKIYVSGKGLIENINKLFYSNDEGKTWISTNVENYLGTNWISQPQYISEMFVSGNLIELGLANDANNSGAELLISTDSGATFSSDKTGILNSGFGTTEPLKFKALANNLYVAVNHYDIYKKNISTLSTKNYSALKNIQVYPNPFSISTYIQLNEPLVNASILMHNILGKKVLDMKSISGNTIRIDRENLQNGIYFLEIIDTNQKFMIKKLILTN